MLGTLAKWLRIMGYDAAYAEKGNDNEIIELAEREDRVLLTRDRELSSRHKNSLLIDGTELEYQIKKWSILWVLTLTKKLFEQVHSMQYSRKK